MMKPIILYSDYMVMKGNMLCKVGRTPMSEMFKCENGFSVSLCICVCMCIMCRDALMYGHACGSHKSTLAVILQAPATLVFETGQLIGLGVPARLCHRYLKPSPLTHCSFSAKWSTANQSTFSFMCVVSLCTFLSVHVCTCGVQMSMLADFLCCSSPRFYSKKRFHVEVRAHWIGQMGWLASPRNLPVTPSLVLGLYVHTTFRYPLNKTDICICCFYCHTDHKLPRPSW